MQASKQISIENRLANEAAKFHIFLHNLDKRNLLHYILLQK